MDKKIYEKVRVYIEKYKMIAPGDTIVTGVSGGADSVCLLLLLYEMAKRMSFRIVVVHINHGIRQDAASDAIYVKKLCSDLALPFFLIEENVKNIAKAEGVSEEEAGRIVRYGAFEQVLLEEASNKGKIAVAHNANDRAETMLFHLFRGTGLTGASGIKPCRGQVIRPILCLERWEIEEFLQKKQMEYCMDATNLEDNYTRNRIRHHILPYAESAVCSATIKNMCSTADVLLETEGYIRQQAHILAKECMKLEEGKLVIYSKIFSQKEVFMQKQILLLGLELVSQNRKDISTVHIRDILSLLHKMGTKQLSLPHGICVSKEYERLCIWQSAKEQENTLTKKEHSVNDLILDIPGKVEVMGLGIVEFSLFLYKKCENIPQKTCTKWFDYDRITKSLLFRTRKTGDFLTINTAMCKKTLKEYMIGEKIPKNQRDQIFVLVEGNHVLWVPGYRISQYYKVTEDTKRILEVRIMEDTKWQKE